MISDARIDRHVVASSCIKIIEMLETQYFNALNVDRYIRFLYFHLLYCRHSP